MGIRTDLATELRELNPDICGIKSHEYSGDGYKLTVTQILNDSAAKSIGKPQGKYVTIEANMPFDTGISDTVCDIISHQLSLMLPDGDVLVAGLGNINVTPDAIGPRTASKILVTRHIMDFMTKRLGLCGLRCVAAVSPGVLGQTGIETLETISAAAERVKPKAVIVIDALAARRLQRLGKTVQLCDTGILPGSGVGNKRAEISRRTLGVKVLSIGIPTVADAATVIGDAKGDISGVQSGMIVTTPAIDNMITRASTGLAKAINSALQPNVDKAILESLF